MRSTHLASPEFLVYLIKTPWFVGQMTQLLRGIGSAAGSNVRTPRIGVSELGSIKVDLPIYGRQLEVVSFLDRETAEIDTFIADQEELIGLLAERRAATISHAVTKGLDPTVAMKDSGVEWLGMAPAHWAVTRISRFFGVTLGKMLDAGKETSPEAIIIPYIRAANIQEYGLETASVNEMAFTATEVRNLDIRAGDLLVVEGGAIGVNVYMDLDLDGWSFQKTVNRVRPLTPKVLSRFLGFALDTLRWSGVIDMVANKSTIAHLTAEKLEGLIFVFPPLPEQAHILDYLVHETVEFDAAIADARMAITLSRERRAAVISAAVTGKIDVRDAK